MLSPVISVPQPVNELRATVFPNPAADGSLLEVDIPATGRLVIDLVSINGQQLATVYSGNAVRGKHRISLRDKIYNLASGTYLLRVATVHRTIPVKLVIP